MSPRPPTSTLFPYTTLFRDVLDLPDVGRDQRGANRLQPLGAVVDEDRDQLGEQAPIAAEPAHGHREIDGAPGGLVHGLTSPPGLRPPPPSRRSRGPPRPRARRAPILASGA